MIITIHLHGPMRLRVDSITLVVPPCATAQDALHAFFEDQPAFNAWAGRVRIARDMEYLEPGDTLHDGEELHVIPPVSGG